MKKLIILAAITLTFASCKKCWQCRHSTIIDNVETNFVDFEECGMTRSEIRDLEKGHAHTSVSGNQIVSTSSTCK